MIEAETETAESPIKKAGQMVLTMGSTSQISNLFVIDSSIEPKFPAPFKFVIGSGNCHRTAAS